MGTTTKFRMYVDEVGNSDLNASENPNHRYLSLTGIILELDYVQKTVYPQTEDLKRSFFNSHPDDPVIFHRKEMVNKVPPFDVLRSRDTEIIFNQTLLDFLKNWKYTVITVVIDKLEFQQRYGVWRFDPYHYCLTVLVERYVLWLQIQNEQGDVMAESRGGKEDLRLKNSFERVNNQGSDFIEPDRFSKYLTSKQLKVRSKSNNVTGLQIADLIAHPSYKAMVSRKNNQVLPDNFGGKIADILEESKLYRSPKGQINGWGRKWLP
jgi:hypothetical protein